MTVAETTLTQTLAWLRAGRRVVTATLFETEGSSPFRPGAKMVISADGEIEGSVTGGCVEAAVTQEALGLLESGERTKLLRYGISDELAGTVGLMCGGIVHIALREVPPAEERILAALVDAARDKVPSGTATVLDGPDAGALQAVAGDRELNESPAPELLRRHLLTDLRGMIERGTSGVRRYGTDGAQLGSEIGVFFEVRAAAPRLLIFGAVDFSAAVAPPAARLGYRVTICDAREAFARSPRFREAAEVVVGWPQELLAETALGERDAVLVFTHDPKFDEPALIGALGSGAGYVGALGSRRTAADRERRLREAGVGEADLARIHSPCGLDLGAATPEETAISILGEIIAERHGRSGVSLRAHALPIHASDR
ncbi:MAG: XdhC family protein [Actinobacteria bacterium]|nr:XdhC family protein [Actinomycetota bacterium]